VTRVDASRTPARPLLAAFGLMLGPAAALGLGRFAYALVLPEMRMRLHWSFATAGALNTANALGYLIGALAAAAAARRLGERRAYLLGLAVTAVALLGSATTGNVPVQMVIRLVAGISGALCFVIGGGLVAQAGRDGSRGRATLLFAVYFAGAGAGIVLSGLLVPAALGLGGWRLAWLVLGALAALFLGAAVPAAYAVPETSAPPETGSRAKPPLRRLAALMCAYALFGAGYIAYMTFIVAVLEGTGGSSVEVTLFWSVLGVSGVLAAFAWSPVLSALRPGRAVALVLVVVTAGAALPVVWPAGPGFFLSAVLFGGSFLIVVTSVTAAVRRSLPPEHWTAAIAAQTVAFALGQCVGPVLAGVLSDGPGGVRIGLVLGAGLLALAVFIAPGHDLLMRDSRRSLTPRA
jgi:predicted MFS family arabinose efflux permease